MFPVFWAQKGSYLVKTSWKMNPFALFSPKIDVWYPKTKGFPLLGGRLYVTPCIWKPLCNPTTPPTSILVNLRTFPEEISEETWGIFHSRGAPPCPTSAVAESFGKRCYPTPLLKEGSKLGSRVLGGDHPGGHLFYPL